MALQSKDKTISAIQKLKNARDQYMVLVGDKYVENVTPFCEIITTIMKAQGINVFDAINVIKSQNLPINNQPGSDVLFGCAVYEIVEEKYFNELKN